MPKSVKISIFSKKLLKAVKVGKLTIFFTNILDFILAFTPFHQVLLILPMRG
jgi:hypothetical protein